MHTNKIFANIDEVNRDVTNGDEDGIRWHPRSLYSRLRRLVALCAVFQHFLLANGMTEEPQKLHLLLALVGSSTFRLLTNLVAPRQSGELTYKEALTELESDFKPKPIKLLSVSDSTNETSKQGTTVSEYVAEL